MMPPIQRLYNACKSSFSPNGPVSEEALEKVRTMLVVLELEAQGALKAQALVKASLCPLQPDSGEEEKEKEVGDRGALVDHVAPCAPKRRLREGASRRPEPRRTFHNYAYDSLLLLLNKLLQSYVPIATSINDHDERERGRSCKRRRRRGKPGGESREEEGSRFVVESKVFEVEAEERNGKSHAIISESKGGLVSWVRLGLASVGLFIEGLIQCTKDGKDGRWEKGWKEKEDLFPGKGEKGGWVSMVESLLRVGFRREEKEVDRGVRVFGRSYVEVARGSELRDTSRVRVETKEEEIRNNVSILKQCLIDGGRSQEGSRLGGEISGRDPTGFGDVSPRFGCSAEDEDRKEAWVRILGLPISLWVPSILRRVVEECSGFLGIDPLTERKEDLEWARIQVKLNGGALPSSMEIGVEGSREGEVRGDGDPRAGWRVGEKPGVGPKEQRRSEEVTGEQVEGEGGVGFENWTHLGQVTRQSSRSAGDGSSSSGSGLGPVGLKRDYGPTTQGPLLSKGVELAADGIERGPAEGRASEGLELLSHGPTISVGGYLGQLQTKYMGIVSQADPNEPPHDLI
ncbi:hypothetical protein CK203_048081 [Vitis vinifera]|uniref:Uncharacterized protein n=1 Tax=Vitis vinifera TaxID=29760 RepID=A0A438GYP5_VITVI|nr:hypothetical protein CK203_048081 [Vitis vinifera]